MTNVISEPTFKHGVIEMVENTKIEWCDHTFNPWIGCQKVSPGCDRCYAEAMMDHTHGKRVRTSEAYWKQPFRWAKAARESGTRPRAMSVPLCPHC
jgi:protein gp37